MWMDTIKYSFKKMIVPWFIAAITKTSCINKQADREEKALLLPTFYQAFVIITDDKQTE